MIFLIKMLLSKSDQTDTEEVWVKILSEMTVLL